MDGQHVGYCCWIFKPWKQTSYQVCRHTWQLDWFSRNQEHTILILAPLPELCFLLHIGSHTFFMWDLMLTIFSSLVWSQGSLIPKLGYRPSLQPDGNVPLYCMNTWNNEASRKSPHFIVCSLSGALVPADTTSPYWTCNGCQRGEESDGKK